MIVYNVLKKEIILVNVLEILITVSKIDLATCKYA